DGELIGEALLVHVQAVELLRAPGAVREDAEGANQDGHRRHQHDRQEHRDRDSLAEHQCARGRYVMGSNHRRRSANGVSALRKGLSMVKIWRCARSRARIFESWKSAKIRS